MFDKNYRPWPELVGIYCDYMRLPYRFRQKMKIIQHEVVCIRRLSKCKYKLCLFDDSCCLLDPLRNRLIWMYDYYLPMCGFFTRLDEIQRLYEYENDNKVKNLSDYNDFQTLKKKYPV